MAHCAQHAAPMLNMLTKHKGPLKGAGFALLLVASAALVWFTVYTPERGRDPLATAMEENSAPYFATERDITALAQDAKTGAARSIGLSGEYALVGLKDGGRYYVRTGEGRALLTELLKTSSRDRSKMRPLRCFHCRTCSRRRRRQGRSCACSAPARSP